MTVNNVEKRLVVTTVVADGQRTLKRKRCTYLRYTIVKMYGTVQRKMEKESEAHAQKRII